MPSLLKNIPQGSIPISATLDPFSVQICGYTCSLHIPLFDEVLRSLWQVTQGLFHVRHGENQTFLLGILLMPRGLFVLRAFASLVLFSGFIVTTAAPVRLFIPKLVQVVLPSLHSSTPPTSSSSYSSSSSFSFFSLPNDEAFSNATCRADVLS